MAVGDVRGPQAPGAKLMLEHVAVLGTSATDRSHVRDEPGEHLLASVRRLAYQTSSTTFTSSPSATPSALRTASFSGTR